MKILKTTLILVNLVLLVLQFIIANTRSSDGDELSIISSQLDQVISQNRQLESIIYSKSSLSYINSKASEVGLVPLDTTQFTPLTVAQSTSTLP